MLLIGEVARVGACVVHNGSPPVRSSDSLAPMMSPTIHPVDMVRPSIAPKRRQVSSSNTQVGYDKLVRSAVNAAAAALLHITAGDTVALRAMWLLDAPASPCEACTTRRASSRCIIISDPKVNNRFRTVKPFRRTRAFGPWVVIGQTCGRGQQSGSHSAHRQSTSPRQVRRVLRGRGVCNNNLYFQVRCVTRASPRRLQRARRPWA